MKGNTYTMSKLSTDRANALQAAMDRINKKHTAGSAMYLGSKETAKVSVFSTGSLSLDIALGVGGLPVGRIIEIYGPESSGKTTLSLHAVASAQQKGGQAVFIDAEHALDPKYAKDLGVDTDSLIISQPDNGEQALDIAEQFILSQAVDLVVIDSVAALVPKSELEGEMGSSSVGVQARLMSQALRKITAAANQSSTTVIFINQLREKIGVMFGSPETTTGGKALKFYASVRLDIRRIETLKEGTEPIGNRVRIKVVKNKVAAPFKQAETDIMFGKGFSREGDILTLAQDNNLIRKGGAWFSTLDGEQMGQGKENAKKFLRDNPEFTLQLEKDIRAKLLPDTVAPHDAPLEAAVGSVSEQEEDE
jgi:recombination protein RecA